MPHKKTACLTAIATALVLAACGDDSTQTSAVSDATSDAAPPQPTLTAVTLGEQEVLVNSEYAALDPYVSADIDNGKAQAQICRACHSLDVDGPNMIGPALHGFFGQAAGRRSGFAYSGALQQADFIWTPRALDAWLLSPGRFLPGSTMVFAGVANTSDRNDLIAYLLDVTSTATPANE